MATMDSKKIRIVKITSD